MEEVGVAREGPGPHGDGECDSDYCSERDDRYEGGCEPRRALSCSIPKPLVQLAQEPGGGHDGHTNDPERCKVGASVDPRSIANGHRDGSAAHAPAPCVIADTLQLIGPVAYG